MRYTLVIISAISATLMLTTGCGKAAEVTQEKVIEAAMAKEGISADVNISQDGDAVSFSAKTEAGDTAFSVGENVGMPEGFPKDIPTLSGWKVQMVNTEASSAMYNIMASTAMSMEEVVAFYKKELAAQGWTEEASTNVPGMMAAVQYLKGPRRLNVSITKPEGTDTMVTLTTMEEK